MNQRYGTSVHLLKDKIEFCSFPVDKYSLIGTSMRAQGPKPFGFPRYSLVSNPLTAPWHSTSHKPINCSRHSKNLKSISLFSGTVQISQNHQHFS